MYQSWKSESDINQRDKYLTPNPLLDAPVPDNDCTDIAIK